MRASQRALVGGLSVLLPAAGIAYLGAVSYQEDRGIVAARIDEQFRAAHQVSSHVEAELERALDRVGETFAASGGRPQPAALERLAREAPLAARPFFIGKNGRLIYPAEQPLRSPGSAPAAERLLTRQAQPCPDRGLAACVRAMRQARRREEQLAAARRLELGSCVDAEAECAPDARAAADARRRYLALSRHDDTAPNALLGLARLARAADKRAEAVARFRELGDRFGRQFDDDGVPYGLLAEAGIAETSGDADALLALYERLLGRTHRAPAAVLEVIADRLRRLLAASELGPEQRRKLADLDLRLLQARAETRFAAEIAAEIDELARIAVAELRGRPARGSWRSLIFRRQPTGEVIGAVIDRRTLGQVAASADVDISAVAEGATVTLVAVGEPERDADRTRTLASSGFGQALPHLTLELVNDRRRPDPLDEIVRARGRRHLAITGGLVAILVVGLIATIRGAARERELARLKSEFVATVSHELKTPLTSIRMFAEMLQQDVAGADRGRERRYHDIIIKESERLGLLIANLLDYSQIEKGNRRYERHRIGAAQLMREAVETFERLREAERPEVRLSVVDDADVRVDRDVVVQALLNLLANAAKYGGTEHPIEARVGLRDGGRVELAVADRGPGIPKAEQSRIFKEFYRTPAAYSSAVEGTGLGLALVKRHVEAQGGAVEVDSTVGKGSTFSVLFSRAGDTRPPSTEA